MNWWPEAGALDEVLDQWNFVQTSSESAALARVSRPPDRACFQTSALETIPSQLGPPHRPMCLFSSEAAIFCWPLASSLTHWALPKSRRPYRVPSNAANDEFPACRMIRVFHISVHRQTGCAPTLPGTSSDRPCGARSPGRPAETCRRIDRGPLAARGGPKAGPPAAERGPAERTTHKQRNGLRSDAHKSADCCPHRNGARGCLARTFPSTTERTDRHGRPSDFHSERSGTSIVRQRIDRLRDNLHA